ncbi:hypothetical protein C8F01DRAFT_325347 [Mycena amicta]|nr:hypothetical protein C8F01DRAFT_325347 [Mycena amicta]
MPTLPKLLVLTPFIVTFTLIPLVHFHVGTLSQVLVKLALQSMVLLNLASVGLLELYGDVLRWGFLALIIAFSGSAMFTDISSTVAVGDGAGTVTLAIGAGFLTTVLWDLFAFFFATVWTNSHRLSDAMRPWRIGAQATDPPTTTLNVASIHLGSDEGSE